MMELHFICRQCSFHEWLTAKEEGRKTNFKQYLETRKIWNRKHVGNEDDDMTELQLEMNRLEDIHGDDYPPVRDYRKLKKGAAETVRSIIIMVNAMLRLCETSSLKRLFEDDDIDIPSLGLGVDGNPNKRLHYFWLCQIMISLLIFDFHVLHTAI